MNTNEMNDGNIFILNYTFNRKLRLLQSTEEVIQLRKKEADVLALLCENYPNPVSQNEFLMNVWGGGYVTTQSIAQVIRSLRISLGDKKKNIISTIPKLGYKLTVTPVYEELLPTRFQYGEVIKLGRHCDDFSYAEKKTAISVLPAATSISLVPCAQVRKRFFSARKLFFTSAILIMGSLVGMTAGTSGGPVDSNELYYRQEPPALVSMQKNLIKDSGEYARRCNDAEGIIIDVVNRNSVSNCFIE